MVDKKVNPKAYADNIPVYCAFDEIVPVEKAIPNPRNPNQHPDEQIELLARIIKAQGWRVPITISRRSGFIVRGHGRLMAAILNKNSEVPVDFQDYNSEAEEWADLIADNRLAELSVIDDSALAVLLEEIKAVDFPIDLSGYNMREFEDIINALDEDNSYQDNFDFEEAIAEIIVPETKPGDIYIINGNHRLMCGDSTSPEDVKALMNGEKARLVVTDPPYNVDYEGTAGKIENDNMSETRFAEFMRKAFDNMAAAARPGAAAYVFHADGGGSIFRQAFIDSGFLLKQCLIWKKNHFVLSRQDYHWIHEPILYGWLNGGSHYFIDERFHNTFLTNNDSIDIKTMEKEELISYIHELEQFLKERSSILEEDKPLRNDLHPTMKPIPLIAKLILNSSKKSWLVLDLFGGSGSTLIATDQLECMCYMMEHDPKFCDVIIQRYANYKKTEDKKLEVIRVRNGKSEPIDWLEEASD